jgi:hypothetical protein
LEGFAGDLNGFELLEGLVGLLLGLVLDPGHALEVLSAGGFVQCQTLETVGFGEYLVQVVPVDFLLYVGNV